VRHLSRDGDRTAHCSASNRRVSLPKFGFVRIDDAVRTDRVRDNVSPNPLDTTTAAPTAVLAYILEELHESRATEGARAMAENAATKQPRRGPGRPFKPGQSGNPAGKRPGTRHRATMLAERLIDGEVEAMVRMAIEKAKQGDMVALRLCLDRILPPRRDRPVHFSIPALNSADDGSRAMAAIATAVASGDLTPSEAAELSRVVEAFVQVLQISEIERRLESLERQQFIGRT
jgi:hypothetical protein